MDLKLNGKTALITGSTKGIGKAIAKRLLIEGANVIINGRSQKTVDLVTKELSQFGTVYGFAADLGDVGQIDILLGEVDKIGSIDILVNNAAIFESINFFKITNSDWVRYLEVNLLSAVRISQYFLSKMLERNQGRIITVASEAGFKPIPEMIHYSVTKTALIGLSRGMAELTKGTNVTVNAVIPGPTWTEGAQAFIDESARKANLDLRSMIDLYFQKFEPTSLLQRFATVDEVAFMVTILASELSSAVNGSSQRVEGGIIRCI
jgi:NAD(P)-dependent dehydrogenase (short-subunit alcohol dehydrogenase family)